MSNNFDKGNSSPRVNISNSPKNQVASKNSVKDHKNDKLKTKLNLHQKNAGITTNASNSVVETSIETSNPFIASKDLYRTKARVSIPKIE